MRECHAAEAHDETKARGKKCEYDDVRREYEREAVCDERQQGERESEKRQRPEAAHIRHRHGQDGGGGYTLRGGRRTEEAPGMLVRNDESLSDAARGRLL